MHAPTLTPDHAPHQNHDEPQDPWQHVDPYQRTAQPYHERVANPTPDDGAFYEVIDHGYHAPAAPEPDYNNSDTAAPTQPAATQEFYVGQPDAELERRRLASLQASFALARTLRATNPELLAGLHAATSEPATALVQTPPRHGRYRGRHRK